jgi:hypothetical protein
MFTMDTMVVIAAFAIGLILFALLLGLASIVERTAPPDTVGQHPVSGSARQT